MFDLMKYKIHACFEKKDHSKIPNKEHTYAKIPQSKVMIIISERSCALTPIEV
jgi:hypothetical protein